MLTLKAPARIGTEDGKVKGIWVTPQMISKIKGGRASVVPTGDPDVFIPCETLIVAIGQNIETKHYEESGIPVEKGKIVTLPNGGFKDIPGVFAGGDCASGPATVIKAVAAAKVCRSSEKCKSDSLFDVRQYLSEEILSGNNVYAIVICIFKRMRKFQHYYG